MGGKIFVTGNTVIDLLKFSKDLQSEVIEKFDFTDKKLYYPQYIEGKTGN